MATPNLENPFSPPKRRNPDNAELVGKILGKHQEAAMREILGTPNPLPEDDLLVGDLSDEDREAIEKEKRERVWTRQQYIDWAKSFGENEEWVDLTFKFQADGTTIVPGDLRIENQSIAVLPKGISRVEGALELNNNQIESLVGFPKEVGGAINLDNNLITSLKGLPKQTNVRISLKDNQLTTLKGLPVEFDGSLVISGNPIDSLADLPIIIRKNLWLTDIPATSIPSGLEIHGNIWLAETQTELIADVKAKGYRYQIR